MERDVYGDWWQERGSGAMSRVERRKKWKRKSRRGEPRRSQRRECRSLPANKIHRTVRDALKEGEVICLQVLRVESTCP